jgi:hypothetical protein
MARFGSNINPSLGAVNYTPYMQGALAGSQSIAQGIATLGQIAGKSINDYYAKKEEEKKKDEAANSFIKTVEANPAAFQSYLKDGKVDKDAVRSMVDTLGYAGTLQLNTYLSDAAKQAKAEKTKGDAAKYAEFLTTQSAPSANEPEFMSNLRDFRQNREFAGLSAEARRAGQAMALEQQLGQAQLGKVRAEELALLRPKQQNLSFQEQQAQAEFAAFEQVNGRAPNAQEKARILDKIAKASASTTNIDMGQKNAIEQKAFDTFAKQREQLAPVYAMTKVSPILDDLLNKRDLITGPFANVEMGLKSAAQAAGIANFPEVADTQTYMNLIGQRVASQIRSFGSGTAVSEKDLKYATAMSGADVTHTIESLRELNRILKELESTNIRDYEDRVTRVFGKNETAFETLKFGLPDKTTKPPAQTPTTEMTFDGSRLLPASRGFGRF